MKKLVLLFLFFLQINNPFVHSINQIIKQHAPKIIAGFFYLKLAEHLAKKNIPPSIIAKNIIGHYCATLLTTLAHECGHALVEKILYNSNIDIHIGSNTTNKEISLFSGITLEGFCPDKGFVVLQKKTKRSSLKDAIVLLAGSFFGIFINIIMCLAHYYWDKKRSPQQPYKVSALFYKLIFFQLLEILIPIVIETKGKQNDAYKFYKNCLNISDKNIQWLGEIAELSMIGAIIISTFLGSDKKDPISSKLCLSITNFLLSEYACFSL
jgi:hypothetical protein